MKHFFVHKHKKWCHCKSSGKQICNGIYKPAIKILGYTSEKKPPTKSQFAQIDDKPKGFDACFWMYAEQAYKNHWSLVYAAP